MASKYGFLVVISVEGLEKYAGNTDLVRDEVLDKLSVPEEKRKLINFHSWIDETRDICFFKFRTADPLPGFPLVREGDFYRTITSTSR